MQLLVTIYVPKANVEITIAFNVVWGRQSERLIELRLCGVPAVEGLWRPEREVNGINKLTEAVVEREQDKERKRKGS